MYIKSINEGKPTLETEILSEKNSYNEMLMIGLRTQKGVSKKALQASFNPEIIALGKPLINQKIKNGFLVLNDNFLIIPNKHWFFADGIASDLFLI